VTVAACPTLVQNVRGKVFPMGGLADVSSHPRVRRKGYTFKLIRHAFDWLKEHGYVFSCLYPFRESFYQRLGYATFPQGRKAIFDPAALKPILRMALPGEIEHALTGDGYDEYHDFIEDVLPTRHGMAMFADPQKESAQSNRAWLAFARINEKVDGLMSYSMVGEQMMEFNFRAVRFYYRTPSARYLLLNWIARHIDQANKVEIWLPPYEQPNTWLNDMGVKLDTIFVSPMGRILNLQSAGGMQVGEGKVNVEVDDPDCSWNQGVWEFEGGADGLRISPTENADFRLNIQAMSALFYGTNDPADFPVLGWGDPNMEQQAILRRMFPLELPYLHEFY